MVFTDIDANAIEDSSFDTRFARRSCEMTAANVAITLGGFVCFLTIAYLFQLLIKKYSKVNKLLVKRLKNCGKILFSAWQIATSLPSVVPTIPLPETFKQAVGFAQVLNGNIFTFIPVGCFTGGGFNYYHQVLSLTLVVLVVCAALLLAGWTRDEERREGYFNSVLALTYLTLPTITTLLFGMIPCDTLDDGNWYLRADYNIICDDASALLWSIYTVVMIMIFPVGVTSGYSYMLSRNRDKINRPVEEREKDDKLMAIGFLFDPYKPKFWYFEIVETVRRLAMTGVLSIIAPGSFTQLSVGLLFSFIHTLVVTWLRPYNEARDNLLSILSDCQLILVFMSASFLKYRNGISDPYDSAGMGAVLLFSYFVTFVAFSSWAFLFKDDLGTSNTGMASNVLRGKQSNGSCVEGDEDEDEDEDKPVGKDSVVLASDKDVGVEMTGKSRSSSLFESTNPMARDEGRDEEGDKKMSQCKSSNWKKTIDKNGNEYSYDETSGRTSWSDKSQADEIKL